MKPSNLYSDAQKPLVISIIFDYVSISKETEDLGC